MNQNRREFLKMMAAGPVAAVAGAGVAEACPLPQTELHDELVSATLQRIKEYPWADFTAQLTADFRKYEAFKNLVLAKS